jgi:hypothetical protein
MAIIDTPHSKANMPKKAKKAKKTSDTPGPNIKAAAVSVNWGSPCFPSILLHFNAPAAKEGDAIPGVAGAYFTSGN